MKENELYGSVILGAKKDGIHLVKIVDGSVGKKPFDMFGIIDGGIAIAVEVKVWRKNPQLPPLTIYELPKNTFEPQQLPWLQEWDDKGGVSFVLMYCEYTRTMYVYDMANHRLAGTLDGGKTTEWRGWKKLISDHWLIRKTPRT